MVLADGTAKEYTMLYHIIIMMIIKTGDGDAGGEEGVGAGAGGRGAGRGGGGEGGNRGITAH